jgi:glycosyltransferase involved in cell wall biosynthesis
MMISPIWAAVIPAFNARSTIGNVVEDVSRFIRPDRILVVDDGSTDGTSEAARQTGVATLHRENNGGKGCALRDGFEFIKRWKPDWVVCLDADGQHDPAALPAFQEKAASGRFDLIIGDRTQDLSGMPRLRRFSNRCSSFLLSLRTGWKLRDVQCGYRALNADALQRLHLRSKRYDIEVEMILRARQLGLRVGWVPVPTVYRNETSYLKKIPETLRFIKLLLYSPYEP